MPKSDLTMFRTKCHEMILPRMRPQDIVILLHYGVKRYLTDKNS